MGIYAVISMTIVTIYEGALHSYDRFAITVKPHTFEKSWRWKMVIFREKYYQQELF